MQGGDEEEVEGGEFDEIDSEVGRGGVGLEVGEEYEFGPE